MSFWDWAVAVYGDAEVAALCLALQDEDGQCVPLLLWAAWASGTGVRITEEAANAAVGLARTWAEDVIAPLRRVRRRLKTMVAVGDDAIRLPLREVVKTAELKAEEALMAQLEALAEPGTPLPPPPQPAVRLDALLAVSRVWQSDSPEGRLARLTEALIKAEILRYNG